MSDNNGKVIEGTEKFQSVAVSLTRLDGHSLTLGKVVEYRLQGFPFRVIACREGMMIEGKSPWFAGPSLELIGEMIRRAMVHQQHLASFPVGTKQEALDEEEAKKPIEFQNRPRLVTIE